MSKKKKIPTRKSIQAKIKCGENFALTSLTWILFEDTRQNTSDLKGGISGAISE